MSKITLSAALAAALSIGCAPAGAASSRVPDVEALITPAMIDSFREMLEVPVILMSVEAQNQRRKGVTQAEIEALDQEWRAEAEAANQPLIAATMSSPASAYLTQEQANARGLYAALFVMDQYGLNVGQSAITSDYWQGDEAKFENTFPNGAGAVFIGEPEYDDAFNTWLVQVNLTIDKDGSPIGAATVELDLNVLAHRAGAAR